MKWETAKAVAMLVVGTMFWIGVILIVARYMNGGFVTVTTQKPCNVSTINGACQ